MKTLNYIVLDYKTQEEVQKVGILKEKFSFEFLNLAIIKTDSKHYPFQAIEITSGKTVSHSSDKLKGLKEAVMAKLEDFFLSESKVEQLKSSLKTYKIINF